MTIAAAFLASLGFFNIFIVALLGWLGDTVGDIVLFFLGRFGSTLFQKKSHIDVEQKQNFLCTLDALIEKHFTLSLLLIKFTPYAPLFSYPYLGASSISALRFIITTSLLSLPVPIIIAVIGYHLTLLQSLYETIPEPYRLMAIIGAGILLILISILGIFLYKKYKAPLIHAFKQYIQKKIS